MGFGLVEQMAIDLRDLEAQHPTVVLELPLVDAWMLIGELQLALRHPENTGPSRDVAARVKELLVRTIATTPSLARVAAMGDDPRFDS